MAAAMIITGFFIMMLSWGWAWYRAFRLGPSKGALALLVPGYVDLLAKRNGFYRRISVTWAIGAGLVALGTLLYTLK